MFVLCGCFCCCRSEILPTCTHHLPTYPHTLTTLRVLKTIGKGAFGTAVLCEDLKSSQKARRRARVAGDAVEPSPVLVVVKMVTVTRRSEVRAARNEIALLSRLDHPFIVSYR